MGWGWILGNDTDEVGPGVIRPGEVEIGLCLGD